MQLRGWLLLVLLATLTVAAAAKERTWTSTDGRTMRAEFVRELDGEATFLIAGKLMTIPLDRLSERDQQIVRDLAAGKEVPDETPAAAAPAADDPFTAPPAREADAPAPAPAADRPPVAEARPPSLTKRPITPTSRVWTDNLGRKTTGKFVRVFNGSVVLSRAGGPISIPFFDLVEADQQYVKNVLASRNEDALIPERPAVPAEGTGNGGPMPPLGAPHFGGAPLPLPPAEYYPPAVGADPGSPTTPMGYGPGGYSPDGYGPAGGGASSILAEHEQRATSAVDAAQRQADQMMQAQEDRMNQMMQSSSPLHQSFAPATQRVPVCSACKATLQESETHGKRCPRCGAWWTYDEYHNAGSSSLAGTSAGSTSSGVQFDFLKDPESKRAVYGGIAVVVVLAVLTAVVIGVIAVAIAIASASRSSRQYKEV
jgi:hypothetical protein